MYREQKGEYACRCSCVKSSQSPGASFVGDHFLYSHDLDV